MMRSPLQTVLLNRLNLSLLALAAAAGLCAAWWLFPLGLALWAVMCIVLYRDPALHISHKLESRASLAQRFQQPFDRIERGQVALFNALASTPAGTRRTLQPVQDAVGNLTDQAYHLCQRMSVLENHRLISRANRNLDGEMAALEAKISQAAAPAARQDYEEARQALAERVDSLNSIAALLERVEAQLSSTATVMDTVLTETLRLQAMGASRIQAELSTLLQTIQDQGEQLAAFEQEAPGA